MRVGIDHDAAEMDKYANIVDQMPFRRDVIMKTLDAEGYKLEDLQAQFAVVVDYSETCPSQDFISLSSCSYQRY